MAIFGIVLSGLSVCLRLVPHAPNFAPVGALAIFAGAFLPRKWGWALPISAMAISDFFIGFYNPFIMASVYGSFILNFFIGFKLKKSRGIGKTIFASLAGSVLFFIITNFAVWLFSDWYPKSLYGLALCYLAAIPFFRNTLAGDLFYSAVFFGGYALFSLAGKRIYSLIPKRPHLVFSEDKVI